MNVYNKIIKLYNKFMRCTHIHITGNVGADIKLRNDDNGLFDNTQ